MAKTKIEFICQSCGYSSPKWLGKCPQCDNWNSFEEVQEQIKTTKNALIDIVNTPKLISEIESQNFKRFDTKITELNRVLGGGIVPGSVILIGGEPGIGKSTIALQIVNNLQNIKQLYVSAEESLNQLKLRAERLKFDNDAVLFLNETNLEAIITHIKESKAKLIIIDSIQTIQTESLTASAGSFSQIKECTNILQQIAKAFNISIILIGHITKEGLIAGPKILEHIVDVVIQFESDRNNLFRIIRTIKNRYGASAEVGIFEMNNNGLKQIINPNQFLLDSNNTENYSGTAIASVMEGQRVFFVESQALVNNASFGTAQRTATGFEHKRLNIIIAVIEKKLGINLSNKDIFVNITGGVSSKDTAISLSIVVAIISSIKNIVVPKDYCFAAEVGLLGEVRPINKIKERVNEAEKLGFRKIFIAHGNIKALENENFKIIIHKLKSIEELKKMK